MLAMLVVLIGAAPASADECQEEEILIRFDGNVFGSEGEIVRVVEVAVDAHLVGATCFGTVTVENNSSEHLGNDFIITSGGTSVEIPDFERIAGKVTTTTQKLLLGGSITASIRLGPHGVASLAGDTVVVASICQPPPTTTTTLPPVATTTTLPPVASTTTLPPVTTTTTLPPVTTTTETPIGGVSAGGGSTSGPSSDLGVMMLSLGSLALLGAFVAATHGFRVARR
jgi:hypothetical protein